MSVTLWPVTGLPEIREGDDLAALVAGALAESGLEVQDGDVLVVSSKVASKAAGLWAPAELADDRETVVASQSRRVVAERVAGDRVTQVVEALAGPVMAAAGVDASNTGGMGGIDSTGRLLLLPHDPDAVCRALRSSWCRTFGVERLGVVLSDTAGRPWRVGQTDFALGAAGVAVVDDLRGGVDADGRPLGVTVRALADEIAASADLVKGKSDAVPVALVRGLSSWVGSDGLGSEPPPGAASLVRVGPGDWFALGAAEAVRGALGVPAGSALARRVGIPQTGVEPVDTRVSRAVAVALADAGWSAQPEGDEDADGAIDVGPDRLLVTGSDPTERGILAARLVVALAGEGVPARIDRHAGDPGAVVVSLAHSPDAPAPDGS